MNSNFYPSKASWYRAKRQGEVRSYPEWMRARSHARNQAAPNESLPDRSTGEAQPALCEPPNKSLRKSFLHIPNESTASIWIRAKVQAAAFLLRAFSPLYLRLIRWQNSGQEACRRAAQTGEAFHKAEATLPAKPAIDQQSKNVIRPRSSADSTQTPGGKQA
jgi:hypothetical protein